MRTPLEVQREIMQATATHLPGGEEGMEKLLIELAFSSRALAQQSSASVLRHMAATADPIDRPGLMAAARFLAGEVSEK